MQCLRGISLELGYIKDVQYKHFWNRALKQPVVQLSKMFWQNIRRGLSDVIFFVNSERGLHYDKRAMLCSVWLITIYCKNRVLKNNNNNNKKDLRRPVSTSSRISQQVNTKTCSWIGNGRTKKRKKQYVWDSLTNVRGFVYYVPPPVEVGKSDLDIVQHPCYSWFMKHMGIIGWFFFLLLFTHRGWSYGLSPTSPNPTHSNCCTRRHIQPNYINLHVYPETG